MNEQENIPEHAVRTNSLQKMFYDNVDNNTEACMSAGYADSVNIL